MKCCCFLIHHTLPLQQHIPSLSTHMRYVGDLSESSFEDVNSLLCEAHISVSHPFRAVSINRGGNSGPAELCVTSFYKIISLFNLYPELLLSVPLPFRATRNEKEIISFQW